MLGAGQPYRFKPAILPSVAAATLMGLFIGLGVWQLNRAEEKEAMLLQYELRSKRPPDSLVLPIQHRQAWQYRRIETTGRFTSRRQFLLDNQVSRGQVGYQVLTPFKPSHYAQAVLVDRGWVPLGASRARLPDVDVTDGKVNLEGTVYLPYGRGFSLGGMADGERGWPLRVQFIDFDRMAKRLGRPLARLIIRLDPKSPHGYRREWQVTSFGPERHLGYAVQWFALAVALLVLYVAVNLERAPSK
jgi:surfeit locus 1 family protein